MYTHYDTQEGDLMPNIQHVQTVLLEETLKELKRKSNKQYSKDALTVAVDHYLDCNLDEMRGALKAAREYIAGKAGKAGSAEILKRIDNALEV